MLDAGLDEDIATKASNNSWTLHELRGAGKRKLSRTFSEAEVVRIVLQLQREALDPKIVRELLDACDWRCCACWSVKDQSLEIHHIKEHSKGGGNSIENLVALCPNHHDKAHTRHDHSRSPNPPEYLIDRKQAFETAIHEWRKGLRKAPDEETNPDLHDDVTVLGFLRNMFDRPAYQDCFSLECSMNNFQQALDSIVKGLNTGVITTGEGEHVVTTKSRHAVSDPEWKQGLDRITSRVQRTRREYLAAVRDGKLHVHDSFFEFRDRSIIELLNRLRTETLNELNTLLDEAGLRPLPMLEHGWQRDEY